MGRFWYGSDENYYDVDDRALAHLQLVIVAKLRRGERFICICASPHPAADGETYWMSPDVPLRFEYDETSEVEINPAWLKALADGAVGPRGLRVLEEPPMPVEQKVTSRRGTPHMRRWS